MNEFDDYNDESSRKRHETVKRILMKYFGSDDKTGEYTVSLRDVNNMLHEAYMIGELTAINDTIPLFRNDKK